MTRGPATDQGANEVRLPGAFVSLLEVCPPVLSVKGSLADSRMLDAVADRSVGHTLAS